MGVSREIFAHKSKGLPAKGELDMAKKNRTMGQVGGRFPAKDVV